MKRNFKHWIVAIAIILFAITSSGIAGIDAIITKGLTIAGLIAIIGFSSLFIVELMLSTKRYFSFTNAQELSNVWNPAVSGPNADPAIVSVVNSFLTLLQPFYVLAIILTGVYLLFIGGTPAGRAKAKSMFWKLVFSMVIVTLSMQLFQIILDLSAGLTFAVASIGGVDSTTILQVVSPFTLLLLGWASLSAVAGVGISVNTLIILVTIFNSLILLIVNLRYIILLILAMLFPFTLFLHFLDFQFTKAFGAKLIRLTFIWAFLPVIMMLAVVGSSIAIGSYSKQCGELLQYANYIPVVNVLLTIASLFNNGDCATMFLMSFVGTIIITVTPFMMSGVMTWVGAGLAMVGMAYFTKPWGTALTTFGAVLAGMGPGGLMMGGTQAMFAKLAPKPPPTPPPTP